MHIGSYLAIGMSFYNVYLLKHRIIKQSIHLTKSKNPFIVKLVITKFYF